MKILTVFTPTYNRASLLPKLYESLCNQTKKDFVWLVVDDGSSDNTKDLISEWKLQKKIDVQYHYKENGGMHTAHNTAYKIINTELNICIDSDDYMPNNAVELILNTWNKIENKNNLAGIIGLDTDISGNVIGTKIPENITTGSLGDLYRKYNVTGDKKLVLRTEIVHNYPSYPEYSDEKLVPLGVLYMMIGKDFDFLYSNDVYCIVDYQADGSSGTILKQYIKSPRGFAYARIMQIKYADNLKDVFKAYIHLVSSAIFSKDLSLMWKDVNPLISIVALPLGILLNIWIRIKS